MCEKVQKRVKTRFEKTEKNRTELNRKMKVTFLDRFGDIGSWPQMAPWRPRRPPKSCGATRFTCCACDVSHSCVVAPSCLVVWPAHHVRGSVTGDSRGPYWAVGFWRGR